MDRRNFLRTFGAGIVALGYDPERFLWVPGAKTIFIPPTKVEVYDATFLEALKHANKLAFMSVYDADWSKVPEGDNPFATYYADWTERKL